MSDARVHEMIADACLAAGADRAIVEDAGGFLAARGLSREDLEAIARSPSRLLLYRRLLRGTLLEVVDRMMPRARARMNRACAGAFDAAFDAFLDEVGPRSHYLRDVPREMLDHASPRWRARGDVAAYLVELASY